MRGEKEAWAGLLIYRAKTPNKGSHSAACVDGTTGRAGYSAARASNGKKQTLKTVVLFRGNMRTCESEKKTK